MAAFKLIDTEDFAGKYMKKIAEKISEVRTDEEKIAVVQPMFLGGYMASYNIEKSSSTKSKSEATSVSLRMEGNAVYNEKKDFKQALKLYTKCIASAPESTSTLALAFANRSAVLRSMGKLEECIGDIQRAIDHRYPETLHFKLLLREAQCYQGLGQLPKALESLQNAMSHVDKLQGLPNERKEQLKQQIQMEFKVENKPVDFPLKSEPFIPKLSYGMSQEAPSASSAVKIEYNETCGRQLVATRDIEPGDVLLIDKPFVTRLSPAHKWSHCNHCLMPSSALLPCPTCDWALYCSERCRKEAAAEYHADECRITASYMSEYHLNKLEGSNQALLIRIIATIGIANLENFMLNVKEECSSDDPRTKGFNTKGQYDSSDLNALYNLVSNADKHKAEVQLSIAIHAMKLLKCCGKILSPNSNKIAALFFRLYFVLGTNSHSIDEIYSIGDNTFEKREVGCGIFPTASLANHSCDPNVIRIAHGNNLVFRAVRPIKKGSEITNTYTTRFYELPKIKRHAILKIYIFECQCEACVNDWPLMTSLPPYPTFSQSEKQLENKFNSARVKFGNAVRRYMKVSGSSVPKAMYLALENNKCYFDEQLKLLSSHGKRLNQYYLKLETDQSTYYQTLSHQHKF